MKDFYSVLGISPGAPADLVKAAFRKKANQLHPDKNFLTRSARAIQGRAARLRNIVRSHSAQGL